MSRHRTRAALTAVLPALLLACGQSATSFDDLGPYAGGASHPWSSTRAPGAVTPLTLDPGRNNLYYEPILSATNGWGPVEINRSNGEQQRGDGRKLSVGGRTYDVGYGVHADSELRWSLKSTIANVSCSKLDGYVGVDDEVGDRGSVIFQIFLDGTRVWDSGVTTGKDAAKFYSVDLRGRTDLRMVVTNGGDNLYYDHADWLQPTVHCEGPAAPPSLPSGTVDRTFTTVRPDFTVVDSAVQADGKVVLFGLEPDEPGVEGYVVARYNADGTKDAAFGTDGRFVQETGTGNRAVDVTIAPDGAIVALGRSGFPKPVPGTTDQNATIVLRLLPDGTPDPAWKLPDGRAGAVTAANLPEDPRGVTVQPDGRVLVSGSDGPFGGFGGTPARMIVARLGADGAPDTSFGGTGRVVIDAGASTSTVTVNAAATLTRIQPDGRVLVGGVREALESAYHREGQVFARLLPDGTPDAGFGSGGVAFGELRRFNAVAVHDLALLPDGRFVVADGGTTGYCQVTRFLADGSVDPAFAGGALLDDAGGRYGDKYRRVSLAVQPGGNLVIAGCTRSTGDQSDPDEYAPVVLRLTSGGAFDKTFGKGGWVRVTDGRDVHLQPGGGLVVGLSEVVRLAP